MEKFPKTYIGRYPTAMSLMRMRSASTNNWAFIEETNTIWVQNKNGEWIDTGKTFVRTQNYKGNPLTADGTVKWPMQGLKVFGKSTQKTTTGAQLFDKTAANSGWIDDNGIIRVDGPIGFKDNIISDYVPVKSGTKYVAAGTLDGAGMMKTKSLSARIRVECLNLLLMLPF